MGQNQSTHLGKHRGLSKSDSTLEFESGPIKLDDKSISKKATQQQQQQQQQKEKEEEKPSVLRQVCDDGGYGYVPTEDEISVNRKLTVPVVFHWEYGGKEVYISGSFNDWKSRIPLSHSGGEYAAIIELPSGTHYFKYLVDGNWIHDPNQKTENDAFGGRNNVIIVKQSDFDVTEALLRDEGKIKNYDGSNNTSSTGRLSPPGSYSQLVPSADDPLIAYDTIGAAVPPSLPPHLLNVILNQDNIDQEDATLLPIPNHVALNHLYALSIKDNVMTLSGTHRYRRKYVTTVLYKPIKAN